MIDNKTYYDEFSKSYDHSRQGGYHRFLDDAALSLLDPFLPTGRVLEIGCGTGRLLERLANRCEEATGVDLSPGMLLAAREKGLNVLEASAEALPFEESSFDLVYSFKVLAHVREIIEAVHEAVRVTRPGGSIVLEFYNRNSLRRLAKGLRKNSIGRSTDEGQVFTRYDTVRSIRSYLPDNVTVIGFEGVRVFTPLAATHDLALAGPLIRLGEFAAAKTFLRRYGGFLTLTARKN